MAARGRRLSDRIIDAFEMACAQDDLEIAEELYRTLEIALTRYGGAGRNDNRQNVEFIREASDRLAALRAAKRAA